MEPQNFKNHVQFVPLFHFFSAPVLIMSFVWSCVRLWKSHFAIEGFLGVVVAAGLLTTLLSARLAALAVQDRVIRMEMRQRLRESLPPALCARINELTPRQLVALRFASDAELADLVREVLDGKLATSKEIKRRVKDWQGDWLRA